MTRGLVLFLAAAAATGGAAVAGEALGFGEDFLTPEERKKREVERKRGAQPVLACAPGALHAAVREGESVDVGFTIRNAGGRILRWAITTAPEWARFDSRSGELGFGEARKLFVTFSAAGLGEGLVSEKIVVEAEGASGSPITLAVELEVERALETPSPEERRPARTVEPAGPWTIGLARADGRSDGLMRDDGMFMEWQRDGPAKGLSIKVSYGIDLEVAVLHFDVDWGISRGHTFIPGPEDFEHELVHVSGGVRGTFGRTKRVFGHVSAGYGSFDYEELSYPVLGRGAGPYVGLGLSYQLGRRASFHLEWRRSRWDGEWNDLGLSTSWGAMEIEATVYEMGLAVHF